MSRPFAKAIGVHANMHFQRPVERAADDTCDYNPIIKWNGRDGSVTLCFAADRVAARRRSSKMENLQLVQEEVIDLGQASAETKGTALFLIDNDGGPQVYAAGIVAD